MEAGFPVRSVQDLESLGHSMKWQHFERLAAWIFSENGFSVSTGVVKKIGSAKRQYDIIAEGARYVIAADCKRWKGKRCKGAALRSAAEKQAERCMFLKGFMESDIVPLVVTLMHEDVVIHEGVPVVPIEKLNAFINSWEEEWDAVRRI